MNTKELIKSNKIWAGLNHPDILLKDADVVIFGIPYDGAVQFRKGASEAPCELRKITYTISPTTEDLESFDDLKLLDLGDCDCSSQQAAFEDAKKISCECSKNEKFFIMVGGDHSATIPVHMGIDEGLNQDFAIIHIDAHFDLCDLQNGNPYSHASTERRAIELNNVAGIDSLFFLGIRSIESDEVEFYKNNSVNVLTSKQIRALGWKESAKIAIDKIQKHKNVYITLDIDGLDPAYAAGTGTPQFGGLDARELLNILRELFDNLNIIGMDVVEVAPSLDPSLSALFAARKIITECMGHWYRKNKGFNK